MPPTGCTRTRSISSGSEDYERRPVLRRRRRRHGDLIQLVIKRMARSSRFFLIRSRACLSLKNLMIAGLQGAPHEVVPVVHDEIGPQWIGLLARIEPHSRHAGTLRADDVGIRSIADEPDASGLDA